MSKSVGHEEHAWGISEEHLHTLVVWTYDRSRERHLDPLKARDKIAPNPAEKACRKHGTGKKLEVRTCRDHEKSLDIFHGKHV